MKSHKAIARILREIATKIENDTCEVDLEELSLITDRFIHTKLNIEETCRELNTTRGTLHRMIADGRVPPPKKTLGGEKYWWKDELYNHIDSYNRKHKLNKLNSRVTSL